MRLLTTFARAYPTQTTMALLALLVGALVEGVGLSALLPLLTVAVGGGSSEIATGGLGKAVTGALGLIGVGATPGALVVLIVVTAAVKSALMLLANRHVGYAVARVATDLRLALIRALLGARWEYYAGQPAGAIANAVATEASRASAAYLHAMSMVALLVQALVYATVAVLVSWPAALAGLGVGLAFFYSLNRLVRVARRAGRRQTTLLRSLLFHLADILQAVKPLKAMAREDVGVALLQTQTVTLNHALRREVFSREALRAFQESVIAVVIAAGLYVALTHWRLPLPTVMVLTLILARILGQLGKVQQRYQQMVAGESAFWSLQRSLAAAEEAREPELGTAGPRLERAIRLDGVGFSYGNGWVLRDVSLAVPAGLFTTVVGPSGAGKTTLVDLVTGLLRPQQGEIWIDDLPLARVDRRRWRRMIGYVPQDTLLLHDTILSNVTLGEPTLAERDAERALRAAGAWGFVAATPGGIHTIIGEHGAKLSGGERQRLAIARALVHGPTLLILDEATSALDAESEAEICASLRALRGRLTILAISHRPALVAAADRVYRVEEGAILRLDDGDACLSGSRGAAEWRSDLNEGTGD
ncbi:MAG: ABC transporter ATP-binding protein [Candidatus Rokubacteria bacterium]|nr:ABC transporter ATP-binding protein [Candidatus Rokubacteria bacterium]